MKVNPYISYPGNCLEALAFYEKCLGGKTVFTMTYGQTPMAEKTPPDWRDKIIHARYEFEGQVLMACDASPEMYSKPQGITLSINLTDPKQAEEIYAALSAGGEIRMPIGETFWAHRFGMFVDRFGIPWMINCEK